jgi:hypothetical protein
VNNVPIIGDRERERDQYPTTIAQLSLPTGGYQYLPIGIRESVQKRIQLTKIWTNIRRRDPPKMVDGGDKIKTW